MTTKGYSIFLIPSGETFKNLSKIINRLSAKYDSPRFEPHVTLIGGVEDSEEQIINKTKKIATFLQSFEIQLVGIDHLNYYLKALFLEVDQTKQVMQANIKASRIFNMESGYEPHLSLLYGNFPKKLKQSIIKDLDKKNLNLSFVVDKIYLYKVDGEVNDWQKVAEFQLKKT